MMFRAARRARIGCIKVAKVLQAYLDGEIDHDTAERVGIHLQICRHCGMKADTYRAIKASLMRRGEWDDLTRRRIEEFTRRFREGPLTDADH